MNKQDYWDLFKKVSEGFDFASVVNRDLAKFWFTRGCETISATENAEQKIFTSAGLIAEIKKKYKELSRKKWEWRSFYNGALEGFAIAKQHEQTELEELRDKLKKAENIIYGIKRTESYFRKDGYIELIERVTEYIEKQEQEG